MRLVTAPLPPTATIKSALYRATEFLAQELTNPSAEAPAWSEFEWGVARAAATIHGIAGLLCVSCRWSSADLWRAFLAAQRHEVEMQQRQFADLLREIDTGAQSAGLAVYALKGAALHARGVFIAGDRPMADLDLVVTETHVPAIEKVLFGVGMKQAGASWKHRMYQTTVPATEARFGESADRPVRIDLHTRVAERLASTYVDITEDVLVEQRPGVRFYASDVAMLRHLLLHASGSMSGRWLRFVQLVDIARMLAPLSAADWTLLVSPNRRGDAPWWMYAPLALVNRYFPGRVQPEALAQLACVTPRMLRRSMDKCLLSEVSASDPCLKALPALAWAHSVLDMARYISARILPSEGELESFRQLSTTRDFAVDDRWFQESQVARLARWYWNRPPRAGTLHAVRGGLESEKASRAG